MRCFEVVFMSVCLVMIFISTYAAIAKDATPGQHNAISSASFSKPESDCIECLGQLGEAEMSYRWGNSNGNFGVFDSMIKNHYPYLNLKSSTRDNFIEKYSISVFWVRDSSSSIRKGIISARDSEFMVIALPDYPHHSLRTFGIHNGQKEVLLWVGPDQWFNRKPYSDVLLTESIMMYNPKLWQCIR